MNRTNIINILIEKINGNNYLEIGVCSGENFNNIKCKHKVSVDPNVNSPASIHLTSDEFFKTNKENFDVIFIDGLHHYEQVQKDAINSIKHLNKGGVIFFNDMLLEHIMSSIFITNGILIFAVIIIKVIQLFIKNKLSFLSSPSIVLLLGIAGISLFIIIFAPFNATRHVLIIIPLIILFLENHIPIKKGRITTLIISANIILGILLAISDWNYANFYRKQAKEIKVTNEKYWSFGHWGWQWYSKKAGMTIYSTSDRTKLKKGDFIILPKYVAKQQLPKGVELEIVKLYIHEPNIFTFFS